MSRPAAASLNALALPPNHAGVAQDQPLSDVFRYHGAWGPGVRLFRAIGFSAKALIIALSFTLPLALVGWNYFSNQQAQIHFSAKERLGVEYQRQVMPLLSLLQRQRLLSVQGAAKGAPPAELAELRVAVAAQMQKLALVQKALGDELDTAKAYAALLQTGLAAEAASGSVDVVFAAHTEHVGALLALLSAAVDGSNLTLDPDIDTYYLMDAAMFRLPAMLESAAQVQGLGNALLLAGTATPAQTRRLIEQFTLLVSNQEAVAAGVAKAITYNSAVRGKVQPEAASAAVQAFIDGVNRSALRGEGPQGDAAAHVAAANVAMDAMAQLQTQAAVELDALISARVDRQQTIRNILAAALLLGLLTAAYLFTCFRMVLQGGLDQVALHINAMRDGNLTTHPSAWGADEVASLMQTLTEMQQSLRGIVRQVRGSSDSIVSASTQIAGGAADLQVRTEQTAASLQETAAAMEQITATVQRNGDTVQEATRLAGDNAEAAARGSRIIGEVMQTMQGINVSSQRIGDIIGTIDGIAFQTNILALNAAVEAARAGEQGRGFAVVASEVRALAQRSASAAREIKTLITTSVEQVASGVKVAHDADTAIQAMLGSTQRVRELLDEVAVGSREQNQGVAQSTTAVQEMDTATQQNAALVEQTAAAAQAMQQQAQQLASGVARFQLPG